MKFNEKVLELCKKIPRGRVTTYKIIAGKLKTKAYRAVGTALKNNNQPIIIPCHRVINSNGSLGGYQGKLSNPNKIELLNKEGTEIKNDKIVEFEKCLHRY